MRGKITWDKEGNAHYWIEGKEVSEEEFTRIFPAEHVGRHGGLVPYQPLHCDAWRNFKSDALAVHPDQVELAEERNKLHGVNVTYDREDGRAIIPDRNERRKLLKVERFHDNDGGYGDG